MLVYDVYPDGSFGRDTLPVITIPEQLKLGMQPNFEATSDKLSIER